MIVSFAVLTVLTSGLTEVIKRTGKVSPRLIPVLAVVIGIVITVLALYSRQGAESILIGVAVGLSSNGLYANAKPPIRKLLKRKN